jgi:hypothetical protein
MPNPIPCAAPVTMAIRELTTGNPRHVDNKGTLTTPHLSAPPTQEDLHSNSPS